MEKTKLELKLALSRLSFLSTREKIIIENETEDLKELLCYSKMQFSLKIKRDLNTKLWPYKNLLNFVKRDLHLMNVFKIGFLHYFDKSYPNILREIFDPPYLLFYRGNPTILNCNSVGIVGTRHATMGGLRSCAEFSSKLAECGFVIVSGLAIGIDSSAHRGALSTGLTVAVLAGGLDRIYPSCNKKLAGIIIEKGGCLVSEYAPGEEALVYRFPQRNRIISGLCKSVVVMECPPKSGSLITADFAIEQNRDLFFHQSALDFEKKYGASFYRQKKIKQENKCKYENQLIKESDSFMSCVKKYVYDGVQVISSVDEFLKA
ncbi:MAG: DNA-processing protein DprA [Treponemataceae bacterium]